MMESGIEDIFTRGCGLSWCSCDKQSKENATSETVDVGGSRIVLHLPSCNNISPTKSPKKD